MTPSQELLAAEALQQLSNPGKETVLSPTGENPLERPGEPPKENSASPLLSPRSSASFSSFDRDYAPPGVRPPPRSIFGNMILTATSLLLPRETQHRLRTFVRMLRLANDSLNRKIVALKDAMDKESQGVEPELSANALRQDIVATIKKSTNMIAAVAGSSLPEAARLAVRRLVLRLPSHWRAHMEDENAGNAAQSAVLSLSTETLHMIRDIITIVDDTLDRAESWCGRLERSNSTESTPDLESLAINETSPQSSTASG